MNEAKRLLKFYTIFTIFGRVLSCVFDTVITISCKKKKQNEFRPLPRTQRNIKNRRFDKLFKTEVF